MKIGDYYLGAGVLYKIIGEEGVRWVVLDMTFVDENGKISNTWKAKVTKSIVDYACESISKAKAKKLMNKIRINTLTRRIKNNDKQIKECKLENEKYAKVIKGIK